VGSSEEGGVPFAMVRQPDDSLLPLPLPLPPPPPHPYPYPDQVWQPDDSLLVLRMTSVGGGALMVSPKRKRVRG